MVRHQQDADRAIRPQLRSAGHPKSQRDVEAAFRQRSRQARCPTSLSFAIARAIGRDPGTVSREVRRNAAVRYSSAGCRAPVAHWKAEMAGKRPKADTLVANPRRRSHVQERLAGQISRPHGTPGSRPARALLHRTEQAAPQGPAVDPLHRGPHSPRSRSRRPPRRTGTTGGRHRRRQRGERKATPSGARPAP
ncbi:helix-turn-helix domain-containing protein [Nocardioides sp. Leaf307]|uniref:helix-turn-helix domain-containing protein n=1 Tax=Nocardioides sp. Leaf307 TaxID=1736331 RepID=UPI0009EA5166